MPASNQTCRHQATISCHICTGRGQPPLAKVCCFLLAGSCASYAHCLTLAWAASMARSLLMLLTCSAELLACKPWTGRRQETCTSRRDIWRQGYPPGEGLADVLLVRHLVNCPRIHVLLKSTAHALLRVPHMRIADLRPSCTQNRRLLSLGLGTEATCNMTVLLRLCFGTLGLFKLRRRLLCTALKSHADRDCHVCSQDHQQCG